MEQLNKFLDELRALDTSDVGRWPFLFRALFVVMIFVIVTAASVYYFPIKNKTPLLEQARGQGAGAAPGLCRQAAQGGEFRGLQDPARRDRTIIRRYAATATR